jgi:23S rRNA pseudouridine2605 synthase
MHTSDGTFDQTAHPQLPTPYGLVGTAYRLLPTADWCLVTGNERLHKVLAHAGIASRRAAEQLILEGRVRVNGAAVAQVGAQVDPERDRIEVDGRAVSCIEAAHEYVLLNKPVGVLSTAHDPHGRPTVVDLVRSTRRRYPVGRLDADSEGLVLLSDDGELAYRMTHARFGFEKEYHALVRCVVSDNYLARLRAGVELDDGPARAVRAGVLRASREGAWVRVVLHEGRKREVRRMLTAIGCPVVRLRRVRVGPLTLGQLRPGEHRRLLPWEVAALRRAAGLGGQVRIHG